MKTSYPQGGCKFRGRAAGRVMTGTTAVDLVTLPGGRRLPGMMRDVTAELMAGWRDELSALTGSLG